ncbi:peptidoglycan-binding protein [Rhizobium giardinii]|uniref:peptidoglycan-binding protein n=1 Tax=Rhizobium giardinii TaxID=56731 RepID=UPI003D6EC7F4
MLAITAAQVRAAALSRVNEANLNSVMVSLDLYAEDLGMNKPHILAQFLPQLMHESGDFRFDREIWGPTPAQKGYDTRTDIGNTPEKDGDGYLYRGRTAMQLTGRSNYRQFRDWCRQRSYNPPDFVASPDLVNTDPWEGLVPLWYWESRNLNKWANEGDIETLTKKINGGKNGLADRINRYGRVALVLLGYRPDNVRQFQADHRLEVDGDAGPKTRAALHQALVALVPGEAARPEVKAAPVTEEKTVVEEKPVAVTPPSLDAPWWRSREILVPAAGGGIATTLNALGGIPWQNLLITLAFISAAGAFLYWRKHSDAKAVGKRVETMAVQG